LTTQLLIGPPASGKTEACIQKIQNIRTQQPLANIWVLLPDSQNVTYFRQRFARSGGGVGVHMGTFSTLYQEVLEKISNYTPVISPPLEHRLVKETIDAVFSTGALSHYAEIRNKPGFNLALQDIFSELRSAYISPERFSAYTEKHSQAKRELALLYEKFISRLQALNWMDRDGLVWQAIRALDEQPGLLSDIQLVVLDGFDAFAGARMAFLKQLSGQVRELMITLPGALNSDRQVHRRSQKELSRLVEELHPRVNEIPTAPHLFPASRHLEAHVLKPEIGDKRAVENALFLKASSQSEEAREVLRWIKALNIRQDLPLHDCVVFVGNLATYRPLLRAAAQEFGIKLRFSHPDSLIDSPAVQSVLNLLQLPLEDFQTRALFNILHCPYFDFDLTDEQVNHLEAVSQHAHIVTGHNQWEETWEMILQRKPSDDDAEDENRGYKDPLKDINLAELHSRFIPFWQIFEPVAETHTLEGWVSWLEHTLEGLHFYEQMTGERDLEACEALGETLKALILSEQVAGVQDVDYTTFLADLQGALQGARLIEPRESRRNALLVGKITEARASRFEAVALMGFSEGIFPAIENPDPFLDETLRHDLGLDPQLGREQPSTFYQAFTRADKYLLMTRPYLSEDGEVWEPSPYWEAARNLFDDSAIEKIGKNKLRPQSEAASTQELLFWGVREGDINYRSDAELVMRHNNIQASGKILAQRRFKKTNGPYEGYPIQLAPALSEKYGSEKLMSAYRLETYGTCPFQFYVQQVLGLEPKEPPELGLDARQVGSMLHRILELVYGQVSEEADLEHLMALLEEVADQVFRIAPKKFGFRPSPLWKVEQKQFLELLKATVQALEEKSLGWTPIGFEAKFGIDNTPPLTISLGRKVIKLRGLIDRVDRNHAGELRVIDYKTGGSHLSKRDFDEGRRLQLPIYGLAAQEALALGEVVEGFYWTIRDAKPSSFKLSNYKTENAEGFEAALGVLQKHLSRILSGIHGGIFPPKPPHGGCPSYCPAAGWCWRYQAGW
jgi:ATP-dependent helicase/DNAse subunit B